MAAFFLNTGNLQLRRISGFSDEEMLELQEELFKLAKAVKKGEPQKITIAELRELLTAMRVKLVLTNGDIDRAIKQIDKDEDGIVSITEMNEIIEKFDTKGIIYKALSERSKIRKDFQRHDKDNNGFITIDELVNVVNERTGIRVSEKHLQQMMVDSDMNADGLIDYEEFCVIMTKSFMRPRVISRSPSIKNKDKTAFNFDKDDKKVK